MNRRALAPDLIACIVLTVVIIAVFYKTVLLTLPISRIALIAEWDSLFSAMQTGSHLHIDPSAVLLALPTYMHIAAQYHAGQLPLWNSLNAFGSPLIGDIQATVFSPLRLLFNIWPTMQIYNLQLVAQVEIAALCTYLLCRRLNASCLGAVAAALSYALCPFVLWYLELQSGVGYVLNPLVLWLFVRAAKVGTNRSALIAGLGAGATILTGHPETSFFAITSASLMLGIIMWPRAIDAARVLGLAALAAFCTCAPTFLPFIEFARNSDCYKYAVSQSAFMPWQAMAMNLLTPVAHGASPFLGTVIAAFALNSFSKHNARDFWSVAAIVFTSFILCAKLWPFSMVSGVPPFNYLITVYAVPLFLLGIAALASLGITNYATALLSRHSADRWRSSIYVVRAVVAVVSLPMVPHAFGFVWPSANFDMTLDTSLLDLNAWKRGAVIAALSVGAIIFGVWKPHFGAIALVAVTVLNTATILCVTKHSLPAQHRLNLPQLEVMEFLRNSGERFLAVGTHLAKPDVNLLYGADDVRSINAMLPPRYTSFVKEFGASSDQFTQWFGNRLGPAMDFGSVRYVLSQTPVISSADPIESVLVIRRQTIPDFGSITGGAIRANEGNLEATGYFDWQPNTNRRLMASICLSDLNDKVVWFGDRVPLAGRLSVAIPIPNAQTFDGSSVQVQLFDGESGELVSCSDDHDGRLFISALPPTGIRDTEARFQLVKQFAGGVRLYENKAAVPRAYFATSICKVPDASSALHSLRDPALDSRAAVVEQADWSALPHSALANCGKSKINSLVRSSSDVLMNYSADSDGVIVLTDTFYPGWKAFVDGKRAPLFRVNYLFRGVVVPAGNHKLTMRYYPEAFTIGVLFFVAFWGFALVAVLRTPKVRRTRFSTTKELVTTGVGKAL